MAVTYLCPGCGQRECQASSEQCWGAGNWGAAGIPIEETEFADRMSVPVQPLEITCVHCHNVYTEMSREERAARGLLEFECPLCGGC